VAGDPVVHGRDALAELARLTEAQRAAFRHVDESAAARATSARQRLARILHDAGTPDATFAQAMQCVRAHARVVVHCHPDRICTEGITVAEGLLRDRRYRNQFETGLSSGGRTAFPGGDRDRWERALFGGAYQATEVKPDERPKYGALELVRHPDGPSPRFGSCYLVLRPAISHRTTFTFAGSEQALAPERVGTIDRMDTVMAALLAEVAAGEGADVAWPPFRAPTLGLAGLTVPALLARLRAALPSPRPDPAAGPAGRVLDSCIEAQVHGPIELSRDVELLVVDPAFDETQTGAQLRELCRRHEIPLRWHVGFRLSVPEVPNDFRGPAMPRLARRIAGDGMLDAAVIGAAEATLHSRPEAWRDWGTRDDTLQHLKQLWHVLVHYGRPAGA
jgi:hypothetical protein